MRGHLSEKCVVLARLGIFHRNLLIFDAAGVFGPLVIRFGWKWDGMDNLVSNFVEALEILKRLSGQTVSCFEHIRQPLQLIDGVATPQLRCSRTQ